MERHRIKHERRERLATAPLQSRRFSLAVEFRVLMPRLTSAKLVLPVATNSPGNLLLTRLHFA